MTRPLFPISRASGSFAPPALGSLDSSCNCQAGGGLSGGVIVQKLVAGVGSTFPAWSTAATWTFEPLDDAAFPAVALAREAAAAGGTAPAVYNAANEACVADFLAGRIGFPRIVDSIARIVSEHDGARAAVTTVADVLAVDDWARRRARELNS